MAKLFASQTAFELATDAMRIHGGVGYTTELPVERYYRDAPLMIIGEGTNEIQRLVIAPVLCSRAAESCPPVGTVFRLRDQNPSKRGAIGDGNRSGYTV